MWKSRRPNQSASHCVYLSIINRELTSESVFECFVSSILSADSRVSAYFISLRRGTATILTDSVNSADLETVMFVSHRPKASRIEHCLFLQESPAVAIAPVALLTFKVIHGQ